MMTLLNRYAYLEVRLGQEVVFRRTKSVAGGGMPARVLYAMGLHRDSPLGIYIVRTDDSHAVASILRTLNSIDARKRGAAWDHIDDWLTRLRNIPKSTESLELTKL